ncbi:hypothetical protein C530_186 [Candidatus Portiera aleyrodidarum BT-B-HRs]|nr:hypothetical protein C530_186 [Candidatus Portiera aleyrodidarum BT-B-HRs]
MLINREELYVIKKNIEKKLYKKKGMFKDVIRRSKEAR